MEYGMTWVTTKTDASIQCDFLIQKMEIISLDLLQKRKLSSLS